MPTINTIDPDPTHAVCHVGGRVLATHVPGGHWAVKMRRSGSGWTAFAVPRRDTTGEPFILGTGDNHGEVEKFARRWAGSAATLVMHLDRIVYVGTGDAFSERPVATCPGCDNPLMANICHFCEYANLASGRYHYCGKDSCYCRALRGPMRADVLELFIPR